eukprot:GHVU01197517.1.p1 GENE.GHVU01197517.1~~GHVU01197517.1.p1  ORF type:complete len:301 (-),score=77.95 GHVU01197517.1:20-922(-)
MRECVSAPSLGIVCLCFVSFFSEGYACTLMRQILAAIYYCHQHNIAHRDLKPENFLFSEKAKDSPLKIIDFGLAAHCPEGTKMKTKAGTPYYVAPQVLKGSYDRKCDLWSAGVMMYILLVGYPPFHGDNDTEILSKVKLGKFSFVDADWKGITPEAKSLIRALLTFDPEKRISAAEAMDAPWFKKFQKESALSKSDHHLNTSILTNFRAFRAASKLKKAAMTVIAQHLKEKEISDLKDIFMAMDANGDGTLSAAEIEKGLTKAGLDNIPADLETMLKVGGPLRERVCERVSERERERVSE